MAASTPSYSELMGILFLKQHEIGIDKGILIFIGIPLLESATHEVRADLPNSSSFKPSTDIPKTKTCLL